jgi:integrase
MVQIAVSTGLTKSQLFNLKWGEIRRGYMDIMKGRKRIHLPLPDPKAIAAYQEQQTLKSDYVFPSPDNPQVPRTRSSDLGLGRICDSLGIKGVTFNTFRTSFAIYFLRENDDPKLLTQIMGYKNNKGQVARYAKIVMDEKREAIKKLSKTLPLDL